ncbi:MAG TPA: CbtA family protein [Candidatus Competibacteraceae bacterium]|nr:CbtA family protein [Candidatus Competibacteraceae bacterium]
MDLALFRRIVFAAAVAGLLAGVLLTLVQQLQVVPIILEAETYEVAEAAAPAAHDHTDGIAHDEEWAPADGWQRTLFTAGGNVLMAIGFGLLLGAAYTLRGQAVSVRQGLLWGLGGFAVFFLAPSLGLPPELPGAWAAPLADRQAWWLLTVACSGAGLASLVFGHAWWLRLLGIVLLLLPHLLGAPHLPVRGGTAPAALEPAFIAATAIANGVFWLALGALTAGFLRRG